MSRVCPNCGAIQARDVPRFDITNARADGFGSLHFGGITVHDWGSDPSLHWPADEPPWRFYSIAGEWSTTSYADAVSAARAAWFEAMDFLPEVSR